MEQAEVATGQKPGVPTVAQEEIRKLKRENAELRRANESSRRRQLFRSGARPSHDEMIRYIDMFRDRFGVEPICRGLGATDRGFLTSRGYRAAKARPDLVNRSFKLNAPHQLWVADITYVRTTSGFCYTAFITDAFSPKIVGGRLGPPCAPMPTVGSICTCITQRQRPGTAGVSPPLGSWIPRRIQLVVATP